ncbi:MULTISPECIES: bluetail domain-containing putative surface protein [unclassified Leptolyngbya]|uniref:bluetail domain-containing putative surface protein n=1 Tax=unclassified Leptolyngbya TaxID=2650499 RepID=UPI0016879715|nr:MULTISPECIES: bluetail domain-containing putative surface protein [unclassified Leptolyngbya]MBD1909228.1 hemolysin [Leptolyngbya sp. FACHB-8]MBD2158826.1 hemolysin [Leptolyngbya sp. FACHB-16]
MATSLPAIVVTTNANGGAGSLRAAIASAQAGQTIRFATNLRGSTITLTSGQLVVNKNVIIDGANAPGLTISGNQTSRVLKTGDNTNVTLRNLIIANGRLTGSDDETGAGAGIRTGMDSTLTLNRCQVNRNTASYGGGIWTGYRARLTVLNSKFDGNNGSVAVEERGGGAIATSSGGVLTVRGSSFVNNRGSNGGAINNLLTQLLVENCLFRNNDSTAGGVKAGTSGYGGAIYVDGADPDTAHDIPNAPGRSIIIRNSRIEGNRGAGQGGGIMLWIYGADKALVENSSITGNAVTWGAGGDSLGGGLRHGNGQLTIRNTTIANNTALSQGGGFWVGGRSPVSIISSTFANNRADDGQGNGLGGAMSFANSPGYAVNMTNLTIARNYAGFGGGAFWPNDTTATLANSIVAYNTTDNPWNLNTHTGRPLTDGGHNIQFPGPLATNDVKVTAGVRIVDPKLAPLAPNGGLGSSYNLLSGSAAVNTAGNAPSRDQRGITRDGTADVGAVEFTARRTFQGGASNDFLVGTTAGDVLLGAEGSDVLMGGAARDRLTGGLGADVFLYGGSSEAVALRQSRGTTVDWITDFNAVAGDRILLDVNDDWIGDRPRSLSNAGRVSGGTLAEARQAAYTDKNQSQLGNQQLLAREAVFFSWNNHTYLAVNNGNPAFSANDDLCVDMTGIRMAGTDSGAGVLATSNYFG